MIDSLTVAGELINEHLDAQDYSVLIDEIENNTDSTDLKDELQAAYPLHDSVLVYLKDRAGVLSKWAVGAIYINNSPLRITVFDEVAKDYTTMDSAIFSNVIAAQGWPSVVSVTGVAKQISTAVNKRQSIYNEFVKFYTDSVNPDTAAAFLTSKISLEHLQQLFGYYLAVGDTGSLYSVATMLEDYDDVIDQDWLTVQGIVANQFFEGLTLFDLTDDQHTSLQEVAVKSEASLATANARAILKYVYNEEYFDDFGEGSFRIMQNGVTEKVKTQEAIPVSDKWVIVPNPSTGNFALVNKGRHAFENISVSILNADNRQQYSEVLNSQTNSALFKLNLSNGIYFIKISDGASKQYVLKLVITR